MPAAGRTRYRDGAKRSIDSSSDIALLHRTIFECTDDDILRKTFTGKYSFPPPCGDRKPWIDEGKHCCNCDTVSAVFNSIHR